LPDLVQDCLDLVAAKARALNIDLKLEAPAAMVAHTLPLQMDSAQIKQVILNLLLNALDAAPAGSEVSVRWERCSRLELSDHLHGTTQTVPGVVLQVSDAGEGISEHDRERIFRPFFTTKSSGTGLGLSICWKIVTAHGGEIRVDRRDERTIFSVLLPQDPGARGRELAQESS
jgi:signal transduction histidine kinase